MNVSKQTFHILQVRISQKVKGIFNLKPSAYHFQMKTKILAPLQTCISVSLSSKWHWRHTIDVKHNCIQSIKITLYIKSRMGSSLDVLSQYNSRLFIEDQYFVQLPHKINEGSSQASCCYCLLKSFYIFHLFETLWQN